MLGPRVNQSSAQADGDIVAGNKTTNNYLQSPAALSPVEKLMDRLAQEIDNSQQAKDIIGSLQFFYIQKSIDGVVGLEAKLIKAGRQDDLLYAFEKKELFVKLLDRYSLYASAQRIFAHLLAKTEHEFSQHIHPQIANLSHSEVNGLVGSRIVDPIVLECGAGPLDITHSIVMGMVYWLAEQCFIRWHQ